MESLDRLSEPGGVIAEVVGATSAGVIEGCDSPLLQEEPEQAADIAPKLGKKITYFIFEFVVRLRNGI